jgi:hypothetical protein
MFFQKQKQTKKKTKKKEAIFEGYELSAVTVGVVWFQLV